MYKSKSKSKTSSGDQPLVVYEITWMVTDQAGNTANTTIYVVIDGTPSSCSKGKGKGKCDDIEPLDEALLDDLVASSPFYNVTSFQTTVNEATFILL